MSDYKKLMGYSDKNKVTKKEPKSKINEVLKNIKEEFNIKPGLNETLPAFPKEWKNLEKASLTFEKAVKILEKSVSKVDKSHSKTINGLWKYTSNIIKKFKELVSKEVLSKLQ